MNKFIRILRLGWAAPVTLCGLLYILPFVLLGWYRYHSIYGDAFVYCVDMDKIPSWFEKLWGKFAGQAIGNIIVIKSTHVDKQWMLVHEHKHVDQVMRLGVFQPIMYVLTYLAIWIGCPGSDPYYSNIFEIDARRAAGQIIDVEGAIKKLHEKTKK